MVLILNTFLKISLHLSIFTSNLILCDLIDLMFHPIDIGIKSKKKNGLT